MSDQSTPAADQTVDQPDDTPAIRQVREALRREQARNAELETTATSAGGLLKENAFLKAGVNTADPMGQFLFEHYDGELTDDAIKAKAAELKVPIGGQATTETTSTTPPPPPAGETTSTQTQARNDLNDDGGAPVELTNQDPVAAGYKDFHERMAKGETREDASVAVFSSLVGAANAGDPRAHMDNAAWAQQEAAKER